MYRYAVLAAALLVAPVSFAQTDDGYAEIREEILEWVIEPCMAVAAALDVDELHHDAKRELIAHVLILQVTEMIREIVEGTLPFAKWEQRRTLYPGFLKACLKGAGLYE